MLAMLSSLFMFCIFASDLCVDREAHLCLCVSLNKPNLFFRLIVGVPVPVVLQMTTRWYCRGNLSKAGLKSPVTFSLSACPSAWSFLDVCPATVGADPDQHGQLLATKLSVHTSLRLGKWKGRENKQCVSCELASVILLDNQFSIRVH